MTAIATQSYNPPVAEIARQGIVAGGVSILLRLEGAAVMAGAGLGYHLAHASWVLFAVLFLVPDLSMLGYLAGRRIGAGAYNAGHSYLGPAVLAALWVTLHSPTLLAVALIWAAHIGFDRMLGYGLKYAAGFGVTHLGFKTGPEAAKTGV
jgi:hypothetical protein